jgi:hypothetical protein
MLNQSHFIRIMLIELKEMIGNREIRYSLPENPHYVGKVMVHMGHKHLHLTRLVDGSYITHFLPFRSYASIKDITADIINKVPAFNR